MPPSTGLVVEETYGDWLQPGREPDIMKGGVHGRPGKIRAIRQSIQVPPRKNFDCFSKFVLHEAN